MKRLTKKKAIAAAACMMLLGMVGYAVNLAFADDTLEQSRIWGEIDAKADEAFTVESVLIAGDHIQVLESEVANIEAKYAVTGYTDGRERAITYILRREALYLEACNQGFAASAEEVQQVIDEQLAGFKGSEGEEQFRAYLESAGITAEAYMQREAGKIEKEIAISKYTAFLKQTEGIYDPDAWAEYEKELIEQICTRDQVRY